MKYIVSKKEVSRREKAFLSLSISFLIGLVLASILFKLSIPYLFFGLIFLFLFLMNLSIRKFFNKFLKMETYLSKEFLIRGKRKFLINLSIRKFFNKFLKMETYLSKEFLIRGKRKFLIKKINKLTIKKTTNNTIREIGIFFDDGKSLFVNGLDNSKNFEINLLKNVDKKVIIKNIREPIDFDNIFFYPFLGLILSFGSVYLLKLMTDLSYRSLQIILGVSMIYVLLLAMYLITSKPIKKRY